MPKQVYKSDQFHGGLNSSSDPRDVADNELPAATDVMIDELGKIRMMGGIATHDVAANVAAISAGYGLFQFSHDRVNGHLGEHLDEGDFATHVNWDTTGKVTDSAGHIVFLFAAGSLNGTAQQVYGDRLEVGIGGATYAFTYTVAVTTAPDGDFALTLDNFSASSTTLPFTAGTHTVIFTSHANASGLHFTITGTESSSSEGLFTIDNVSLKVYNDLDAAETGDDYLAFADTDTAANIDIYSRVADAWGTDVIDLGSTTGMKPTFYNVDGALRVSDGNFNNTNQWYGYVYSKLFQTTGGTPELTLDKWVSTDQELKSFDDLSVNLVLDDCSAASPSVAELAVDQITLGWWTTKGGLWNGQYYLGVSPVYIGDQEGPITESDSSITLSNKILYVQVFIGHTDTITSGTISTHPLNDDRIIGIRLYARSYPSDEWYLLKDIDLIKGGKFGWAEYNTSQTATDFMDGDHGKRGTDNDIYARFNDDSAGTSELTMEDGASDYHSFERATAHFEVDIGTSAFTSGRKGMLRVSGFQTSPLYKEIVLDNNAKINYDIQEVVLPANGVQTLTFEILDESFSVLHQQDGILTIDDSGAGAPSEDGDDGYGGSS